MSPSHSPDNASAFALAVTPVPLPSKRRPGRPRKDSTAQIPNSGQPSDEGAVCAKRSTRLSAKLKLEESGGSLNSHGSSSSRTNGGANGGGRGQRVGNGTRRVQRQSQEEVPVQDEIGHDGVGRGRRLRGKNVEGMTSGRQPPTEQKTGQEPPHTHPRGRRRRTLQEPQSTPPKKRIKKPKEPTSESDQDLATRQTLLSALQIQKRHAMERRKNRLRHVLDRYDTRARELYYLEHNFPLLEFDPGRIKADKGEKIVKYLQNCDIRAIVASELASAAHHQQSTDRMGTRGASNRHRTSLTSLVESTSSTIDSLIPRSTLLNLGIARFANLSEYLSSFCLIDDEELTPADLQSRAEKEATIDLRITAFKRLGLLKGLTISQLERKPDPPPKTHWTCLLEEMKVVSGGFMHAGRERLRVTRAASRAVQKYWELRYTLGERTAMAQERKWKKCFKEVRVELTKRWKLVEAIIRIQHSKLLAEEQREAGKRHLTRMIEHSSQFLRRRQSSIPQDDDMDVVSNSSVGLSRDELDDEGMGYFEKSKSGDDRGDSVGPFHDDNDDEFLPVDMQDEDVELDGEEYSDDDEMRELVNDLDVPVERLVGQEYFTYQLENGGGSDTVVSSPTVSVSPDHDNDDEVLPVDTQDDDVELDVDDESDDDEMRELVNDLDVPVETLVGHEYFTYHLENGDGADTVVSSPTVSVSPDHDNDDEFLPVDTQDEDVELVVDDESDDDEMRELVNDLDVPIEHLVGNDYFAYQMDEPDSDTTCDSVDDSNDTDVRYVASNGRIPHNDDLEYIPTKGHDDLRVERELESDDSQVCGLRSDLDGDVQSVREWRGRLKEGDTRGDVRSGGMEVQSEILNVDGARASRYRTTWRPAWKNDDEEDGDDDDEEDEEEEDEVVIVQVREPRWRQNGSSASRGSSGLSFGSFSLGYSKGVHGIDGNLEAKMGIESKGHVASDEEPNENGSDVRDRSDKDVSKEEGGGPVSMDIDEPASSPASHTLHDKEPSPTEPAPNPTKSSSDTLHAPTGTTLATTHVATPFPFLLKHSLREYQHVGLDWLAGLYERGLNGILADEMGLGKTIQTIALFAHLACSKGVWGQHLVIVPTSVMLNWECEFKKWLPGFKLLTYYGSIPERAAKRVGWSKPNAFHVCITSYQIVLRDHHIFRRKRWCYLVLDEAHNIKNFRSQRWQTLLGFNTERRLLLTGTPLQNNLMELWSLLYFLMPGDYDEGGFAGRQEFKEWFETSVSQIVGDGHLSSSSSSSLVLSSDMADNETRASVSRLHAVLRPYILRRLKADVEKQMPGKFEHVLKCRLSKRQRFLYDDFMSRAKTKEDLASGNYLSIVNVLMQLRKVCNHPDLFEERPVVTGFAIPEGGIVGRLLETEEILIWKKLLLSIDTIDLGHFGLRVVDLGVEEWVGFEGDRIRELEALDAIRARVRQADVNQVQARTLVSYKYRTLQEWRHVLGWRHAKEELDWWMGVERVNHLRCATVGPIYGRLLRATCRKLGYRDVDNIVQASQDPRRFGDYSSTLRSMIQTPFERSLSMSDLVSRFACTTPRARLHPFRSILPPSGYMYPRTVDLAHLADELTQKCTQDPLSYSKTRLEMSFPDKRLVQFDCGKLQTLDRLLRDLIAGGHRALVFTQMTRMLDILEVFLNLHGHLYLRLDGTTKVEHRQLLMERFNNDKRILVFILSTRSGGLGMNLTGADTVIFYDSDWNPAMDAQAQDRAHRIGQTREVHIYRFVSEHTIEENMLRKANQKRRLDQIVIQDGDFTTEWINKSQSTSNWRDWLDSDSSQQNWESAMMQAEDETDVVAARKAAVELERNVAEFGEQESSKSELLPHPPDHQKDQKEQGKIEDTQPVGSLDEYLFRFQIFRMGLEGVLDWRDFAEELRRVADDDDDDDQKGQGNV
ncbi:uncharacterized protein SPPG_05614 [Spizellomyces punctatus DAOM BR117]|uniref:Helicase SWR1 n=1 Tax=Spizellomyces punctatus (strain DAOM BR117) TaxID=645134 RepID=A0A0L0HEG8_SPIPD|nr:uncharacterized protein SPPG_05614 [Spizellomyces punctatus DAOM BR117]KNC99369.1 hypothetical protein SPPG_05614 [Spizellomyces punctatus DAOM BR117]|eukprot:XP_016607409.1 hypothetical protein SPPG_05614 [Spizellomyces punctatus DAOM BR117]